MPKNSFCKATWLCWLKNIISKHPKAMIDQAKLWDNPVLSTDQNIYDGGSKKFFYHNSEQGLGQVFVQLSQVFTTAGKRGKQVQVAKDDAKVQEAAFNDLMRNLRYNLQLDFSQLATLIAQQQGL
jgi:cobalt-zinc-cadmium efflux system outer membrane protein